jgi:hypothetical protein
VFVGYADNLRAGTTQTPNPWAGSTGVNFQGSTSGNDGGAIRVANATGVVETVDFVTLSIGGCTFDIWPHGVSLPSGGQLIVTQTLPGASNGCPTGTITGPSLLDTSDIGANGAGWAGICTQSNVIPQVNVSVDGVVTTYPDSGQVLNTNGVDAASCARPGFPSGNETTQWVSIGQPPCPAGATLTLSPASQTDPVGSMATVIANFAACGSPLQGATVDFAVTSGPNAGAAGSGTVDPTGNASFSYSSAVTGTDNLQASVSNVAGTITSNPVTVNWILASPVIRTSPSASVPAGGTLADTATVSGGFNPGGSVSFNLYGNGTCTGTPVFSAPGRPLSSGGAATSGSSPALAVGTYNWVAIYGGDVNNNPATSPCGSETVVVTRTSPTLPTIPSGSVPAGGVVSDSATVSGGFHPMGTVTFTLFGPGDPTCRTVLATRTGSVSSGGKASSGNVTVGAAGTYNWVAAYSGDANNNPATSGCGREAIIVTAQRLTGRAYDLAANATLEGKPLLAITPIPDTGAISTTSSSTTSTPCVATLGGLVAAHALCVNVTTTAFPGKSTASASVADTTVGIPTIPTIAMKAVQSTSTTTCAGSTGSTTIAFLEVGGTVVIAQPTMIAPNTRISVGLVTLTLNEQIPFSGPDKGLTVNAVHVNVNALNLAQTDVIVASSESDIGNCP